MTAIVSRRRRVTMVVARRLGVTEGQVSTVAVAVAAAAVLTIGGIPPVLRNRLASPSSAPSTPAAQPQEAAVAAVAPPAGSGAVVTTAPPITAAVVPVAVIPVAPSRPATASAGSNTAATSVTAAPSRPEMVRPATGKAVVFAGMRSPGAPEGIAVGPDGTVYVSTDNGTTLGQPGVSQIVTFSPDGQPGRAFTVSGQPDNHALGLSGLALDGKGGLAALDVSTARVLHFDLSSGRQTIYATVPDIPACQLVVAAASGCEPSIRDDPPVLRSAAFDRTGNLYVNDASQGAIWRIPAGGGPPALFLADVAFSSGDGLGGIAVAPDGALVVTSPQAVDPAAAGGGAVYRIAITDGQAGARTLITRTAPFQEPSGVALLNDGSMVVALRAANAVSLIGRDGTEVRRVTDPSLDTPIGVAFAGATLLVTARSDAAGNGAVVAVGIS